MHSFSSVARSLYSQKPETCSVKEETQACQQFMYDSPWGFHKNRPCKLTFALLPGRRESGSRIPRPVPLHYRPCKQNKHGACCCLSVTSCHLSVWVQVSLLAFFLQTLAKETMVYCFSSDCRHHQENYKCRFFRFPSDATKRNQWLRLCR